MESPHPFEKRIKRHVIGPTQTFYVVTAPGLAPLCLEELRRPPLEISTAAVTAGGVEFKGRLPDCYKANLHLRTASRILMRIGHFKATEFHGMERHISRFPWELYLWPGSPLRLRVTCRRSRLYHSRAVRERFETGIRHRLANTFGPSESVDQTPGSPISIFIRAVADTFHISVDSSGELLFKRGIKSHPSRAPIRETLAAGVLIRAGYKAGETLVDPMCGSGTFALEAAMKVRSIPAGWYRDFAFMNWPAFRSGQWIHIRREADKNFSKASGTSIFTFDREETAIRALRKCVIAHDLDTAVHVEQADFFSLPPQPLVGKRGLVILNPPYVRRMGAARRSPEQYAALCEKLTRDFKDWRFAIIAPPGAMPKQFSGIQSTHRLLHGGLRLMLYVGTVA